jgi:succinate dehydrogenase / fumarate reductase cytochrome b subunit
LATFIRRWRRVWEIDVHTTKLPASEEAAESGFLARHQFLIYRLFSLAGLMPVGAYVVVHLATNASVLAGAATFQEQVNRIHSLGPILPLVEWTFIFIPILFHALVGFWIISGGLPNVNRYPYGRNIRYTLQRATGMIAAAFILFHVWQLHHYGKHFGGGEFDPHHAASSAASAIDSLPIQIIYAIGTLSAVYHLSNGLWTFGITWGIWVSEAAQNRASKVCAAFGIVLAIVSMGALYGMAKVDVPQAKVYEDVMLQQQESVQREVEKRLNELKK